MQFSQEVADKSSVLLADIFTAFREERKKGSTEAYQILQDKIAEHAGDLVSLKLSSLKELVDTLMKLEGAGEGDDDTGHGNEQRLQAFLRKADATEVIQ